MTFQIDPGRPPGEIRPLENQVPVQEIDGLHAMLPLVPAREQQNHGVRQHAGLGHGQHDEMELQDMLPLQDVIDLEQNDGMLEDDNAQPRGQLSHHTLVPSSLRACSFHISFSNATNDWNGCNHCSEILRRNRLTLMQRKSCKLIFSSPSENIICPISKVSTAQTGPSTLLASCQVVRKHSPRRYRSEGALRAVSPHSAQIGAFDFGAKHSPRRFRLGGPEGPFRYFQRKKVIFRFFSASVASKMRFRRATAKDVPIRFVCSSPKYLHLFSLTMLGLNFG